ncbi:STAS domain-containing protein [Priestia sp. JNUCC 25]
MSEQNQRLFEYILENSASISEEWLRQRSNIKGSIYSKDADASVEKKLREQHLYTIETIASGFLDDQEIFKQRMVKWTTEVVNSRIKFDTPIYEVVEALSKTRKIIWTYVKTYSLIHSSITKEDILSWSEVYHTTFDKLINEFSEQYYKITRQKISLQQELIDETSFPVIPIVDHIAVLPLVGLIDEIKGDSIIEVVPKRCAEKHIRHLVIDLSGVNYVDTYVAHKFFDLINILQLLGIHAIMSGVSLDMAQTAVNVGISFNKIETFGHLKQALSSLGVKKKEEE